MGGTQQGGQQAARVNRERHGEDYYTKIGKLGGSKSRTGGFASLKVGKDGLTGPERARTVGIKGGSISRRMPRGIS